ncbi:hypothetical protein HMPREF1635_02190 [Clostridiales bacterium S5-A14a]|nr:hypothetical protein HMPREF1635_02190 [Clostridiales bacterium S5-A14a]
MTEENRYKIEEGEKTAILEEAKTQSATDKVFTKDEVLAMIKEVIQDGYILEDSKGKITVERENR